MKFGLFGRGGRQQSAGPGGGWQLYSLPTVLDPPGTIYRIESARMKSKVAELDVAMDVSPEAAVRSALQIQTRSGLLARFLGLDALPLGADAGKLQTLEIELLRPQIEQTTNVALQQILAAFKTDLEYDAASRYFAIRNARSATGMLYRLSQEQIREIGGEAALAPAIEAGLLRDVRSDGTYELLHDFPKRMRVMFLPEEIAPVAAAYDDAEPKLGLFPVRGALEWAETAAPETAAAGAATAPERRYLQTCVEPPGRGQAAPITRLELDTDYVARVFIGLRNKDWLGLGDPVDEPSPNPDGTPVKLDVLFWEPTVCPQPKVSPLDLWPKGDTGVCTFPFRTDSVPVPFAARVAVYHDSRNLQTGVLRGEVGGGTALTFVPDAAPLRRFEGLEGRAGVGASIILDDASSGGMRALVFKDGEAAVADVGDEQGERRHAAPIDVRVSQERSLEKLVEALGRQITKITAKPEDYNALGKDGTRRLLVELAARGGTLLKRLRKHSMMRDALDDADYVQIVRTNVDAFFPVEFLYTGEIPEAGAVVCDGSPDARAACDALKSGKIGGPSPRCCGAYDRDPENTVCPLRFWSLSKVIERHAHIPEHTQTTAQFQLHRARPSARDRVLDPLTGAVLAASRLVDRERPDTVAALRSSLGDLVDGPPVAVAEDWEGWAKEIATVKPHLLIMLPHHELEAGNDFLEIGGTKRKSTLIRKRHVRPKGNENLAPVVLLIGCGTNSAKINLESCVTAFQDEGASIVVSTIGSILGREAGPATKVIVEEVAAACQRPNATFGEAMLKARRRLLAEGMPMVLGLTSYGDADWRIAHERSPTPVAADNV